jgi:hypothetical protein
VQSLRIVRELLPGKAAAAPGLQDRDKVRRLHLPLDEPVERQLYPRQVLQSQPEVVYHDCDYSTGVLDSERHGRHFCL